MDSLRRLSQHSLLKQLHLKYHPDLVIKLTEYFCNLSAISRYRAVLANGFPRNSATRATAKVSRRCCSKVPRRLVTWRKTCVRFEPVGGSGAGIYAEDALRIPGNAAFRLLIIRVHAMTNVVMSSSGTRAF